MRNQHAVAVVVLVYNEPKKVAWEERRSILPKSVWDKYAGKEFWRPQPPVE